MDERFVKGKIRMKFKEQKMLIDKERERENRLEEDFKVIMVGFLFFFPRADEIQQSTHSRNLIPKKVIRKEFTP